MVFTADRGIQIIYSDLFASTFVFQTVSLMASDQSNHKHLFVEWINIHQEIKVTGHSHYQCEIRLCCVSLKNDHLFKEWS